MLRGISKKWNGVAPLAGAWIEIFIMELVLWPLPVAPLAGAWIEIGGTNTGVTLGVGSLPSRERGLKSGGGLYTATEIRRSPRGSVD